MLARDIMTRTVLSVTPDHSVRHAAQIMLDHHISGLPVIDDSGKLVGMLTEGDLLRRTELGPAAAWSQGRQSAEDYIRTHGWSVGDVMTTHALTITETTPMAQIAAMMSTNDIKRVPVIDGDKVVGIVSRADILRGIATAERDDSAPGDEAIRLAISTRLRHELDLDPAEVGVTVSNGNAHLWGRVGSAAARKAAYLAAETVNGVRGVVNDLQVADDPSSDHETAAAG